MHFKSKAKQVLEQTRQNYTIKEKHKHKRTQSWQKNCIHLSIFLSSLDSRLVNYV